MEKLLTDKELPAWFSYPDSFKRIIDQGLLYFDPWVIMEDEWLRTRYEGIKKRYPSKELVLLLEEKITMTLLVGRKIKMERLL